MRIMYPMIISVEELDRANELLAICKEELRAEGKEFNENIVVGMMIETPASVVLGKLAAHADLDTRRMTGVDRPLDVAQNRRMERIVHMGKSTSRKL